MALMVKRLAEVEGLTPRVKKLEDRLRHVEFTLEERVSASVDEADKLLPPSSSPAGSFHKRRTYATIEASRFAACVAKRPRSMNDMARARNANSAVAAMDACRK